MSATVMTMLRCDRPPCRSNFLHVGEPAAVRAIARTHGWTSTGKTDTCGEHVTDPRAGR